MQVERWKLTRRLELKEYNTLYEGFETLGVPTGKQTVPEGVQDGTVMGHHQEIGSQIIR